MRNWNKLNNIFIITKYILIILPLMKENHHILCVDSIVARWWRGLKSRTTKLFPECLFSPRASNSENLLFVQIEIIIEPINFLLHIGADCIKSKMMTGHLQMPDFSSSLSAALQGQNLIHFSARTQKVSSGQTKKKKIGNLIFLIPPAMMHLLTY